MSSFSVAAGAVAPLMFFMVLGFCVSQKAHFDGTAIANFNKLVFKVFLPANMFSAVYFSDISKVLDPRLISYGAGGILTVYLLAYFFVVRLVRDDRKRGAIIQIIYRSNFVILGVPLVENIYGPEAVNMPLMLVTIIPPLYNVLAVFTLEKFRGGRMDWRHILRGVVTNPMILGALIGGLGKLLPFPLPEFLAKALKEMAVGTTPLSLIVLGASFNFESAVGELRLLLACIFSRLVLAPAVFVAGAVLCGFRGLELATLMCVTITPCAVASYTMAQQMDSDGELTGNCVVFTSALSCVTMFLWIFCVKALGLI